MLPRQMPKRRGPYIYKRPGRDDFYAYIDRRNFNISLKTSNEAQAKVAFGELLQRSRVRELATGEGALVSIAKVTRERSETNHTPKTTYEHHLNLRRILRWLEARQLHHARDIDKAIVEDYKTARRFQGRSAARINRELDSWRKMMKVAVERKQAHRSVLTEAFEKMREPRPEPHQRRLSVTEWNRLIKKIPPTYKPLMRVAVGSGLRDEELRHMEASDLRKASIVVTPKKDWTTKGYRYREVPVTPATITAAKAWLKLKDTVSLEKKTVWKVMQRACAEARVDPVSLHDLRRAWATRMMDEGFGLQEISHWLGHANVITTTRYLGIAKHKLPNPKTLPKW